MYMRVKNSWNDDWQSWTDVLEESVTECHITAASLQCLNILCMRRSPWHSFVLWVNLIGWVVVMWSDVCVVWHFPRLCTVETGGGHITGHHTVQCGTELKPFCSTVRLICFSHIRDSCALYLRGFHLWVLEATVLCTLLISLLVY
jgi:hypothetical protein